MRNRNKRRKSNNKQFWETNFKKSVTLFTYLLIKRFHLSFFFRKNRELMESEGKSIYFEEITICYEAFIVYTLIFLFVR
jgi:hypothetical protein